MHAVGIRKATSEDLPRLADALARAFGDDPGWSHLLPHPADRVAPLRLFFETELAGIALPHGLVWTTEPVVGAAVWAGPGAWRVPLSATLREVAPMVRVFGRRLPLALRSRLLMERLHPRRPHHWYLAVMGIEPSSQGRGLGTELLRPGIAAIDAGGLPAYLESSTPRSRALYRRHGFGVTGEFNLPSGGPPIWRMWREPRGDGERADAGA